jgi:hypothetical protein
MNTNKIIEEAKLHGCAVYEHGSEYISFDHMGLINFCESIEYESEKHLATIEDAAELALIALDRIASGEHVDAESVANFLRNTLKGETV